MQSPLKGTFRITQEFGNDFVLNGKWVYKSMGYNGHMGVDFAGLKPGEKPNIYFPCDGFIARKRDDGKVGYGKHIVLHFRIGGAKGQKYRFTFGHLDSFGDYEQGQFVKKGELIGIMGTSGLSTAIHLHWDCMPLNNDDTPVYPKNGFKGFVDFLKLSRGTYTEKDIKTALIAFFGNDEKPYYEKVNDWLVENKIVENGNFTEEQIRVIIASRNLTLAKKLTPYPL